MLVLLFGPAAGGAALTEKRLTISLLSEINPMKLPFRLLLAGLSMSLTSCFFLTPAKVQKDLTYDEKAWGNVEREKPYVFVRDYEYKPFGMFPTKAIYTKGTKMKFTSFEINCSPRYGKGGCYVRGEILTGKLAGTDIDAYDFLKFQRTGKQRHQVRIADIKPDILKPAFEKSESKPKPRGILERLGF